MVKATPKTAEKATPNNTTTSTTKTRRKRTKTRKGKTRIHSPWKNRDNRWASTYKLSRARSITYSWPIHYLFHFRLHYLFNLCYVSHITYLLCCVLIR